MCGHRGFHWIPGISCCCSPCGHSITDDDKLKKYEEYRDHLEKELEGVKENIEDLGKR